MKRELEKYRVREGLFGTSVLQVLEQTDDGFVWKDLKYDQAPRAFVSELEVIDEMHDLEIRCTEAETELGTIREMMEKK